MTHPPHPRAKRPPDALHTAMGIVAILLWSTTIAAARSLSERVGPVTCGAAAYTVGGVAGLLVAAARGRLGDVRRLPRSYLFGCGAVFVADIICLYLAIGLSVGRQQAIEVGILNYLWPTLTLVFAVPIRGARARPLFWLGAALAIVGGALAPIRPGDWSGALFLENLAAHPAPYALGLSAGVLWALYSNLARRFGGIAAGSGVPLFILTGGLLLLVARSFIPEETTWSTGAVLELLFVALLPTVAAFVLWDGAVRRGNFALVASIACLTPLLSTSVSTLYLGVTIDWTIWAASALVVTGAFVCLRTLDERPV